MSGAITRNPETTLADSPVVSRYRTIADLLEQLGGVSPARVRFQPLPGTATVHDVVAVHDADNRLCELVDGVLVEKVMVFDESIYAVLLSAAIVEYLKTHDLGKVAGADGVMEIFPGLVRIPDAAFISWSRYPKVSAGTGRFRGSFLTSSPRFSRRETRPGRCWARSRSTSVLEIAWSGTSIPSATLCESADRPRSIGPSSRTPGSRWRRRIAWLFPVDPRLVRGGTAQCGVKRLAPATNDGE